MDCLASRLTEPICPDHWRQVQLYVPLARRSHGLRNKVHGLSPNLQLTHSLTAVLDATRADHCSEGHSDRDSR